MKEQNIETHAHVCAHEGDATGIRSHRLLDEFIDCTATLSVTGYPQPSGVDSKQHRRPRDDQSVEECALRIF